MTPLGAAACARAAEPWLCPDAADGGLVVTEIRGLQSGPDTFGQWIELYNATAKTLELEGLRVVLIGTNGIDRQVFFVRDDSLTLAAGGHVVLGHQDPEQLPPWVDYGFFVDLHRESETDPDGATDEAPPVIEWTPADLFGAATLEVEGCGALVDRVEYDALPAVGTLALDGAIAPPDADANDQTTSWCNDMTPQPMGGPVLEIGTPGTPGEANPPCG